MSRSRPGAKLALVGVLWIAALAAVIGALIGKESGGQPQLAPSPATVCPGPDIGVDSTLAFQPSAQRQDATVSAIRDVLGARVVRDSLLWHAIEPVQGQFDWSRTDRMVQDFSAAGIQPVLLVVGSPSWANGVPTSTPKHYLYVPRRGPALDAWLQQYSTFLAAAVERYKDVVHRWEIWNEPNLAAYWRPRPDPLAYLQVYETLRRTILNVDPTAQVAVGGLANLSVAPPPNIPGLEFLQRITATRPPLDNVAIHPYTTGGHAPDVHIPGQNNFDDIARVHDQLLAEGQHASIWVTEWGWSSAQVGESRQAQYVNSSLAMLESRFPYVRLATYFLAADEPPEFITGLLDHNLEPKPAAAAFRRHAESLSARCHGP